MNELDFKNIHEWPYKIRATIVVVVALIVFCIGYLWVIPPIKANIATSQQHEQDLKQQLELLIIKEAKLNNDIAQLPQLMRLLDQWKKKLVQYAELPELLNEILKIGASNHLYFNLLNPGAEIKEANDIKIPIKVVVMGSYHQIGNFMSQIANLAWIVAIGNFTISNESEVEPSGEKSAETAASENNLLVTLILDVYQQSDHPTTTEIKETKE